MTNDLTTAELERLAHLAEEAAEVIQAVTKIIRHGWLSTHPSCSGFDNRMQLVKELGDFRGALELNLLAGAFSSYEYREAALNKLARVQEFLHCKENIRLARQALEAQTGFAG